MKVKKVFLLIFLIVFIGYNVFVNAASYDLLKFTCDPISSGMAFSSTVLSSDNIFSVYNNQSSLSLIDRNSIGLSYKRIFNMFNSFNFVYGLPARQGYGAVAVSFVDYGVTDMIKGMDLNSGEPVAINTFRPYDLLVVAGYGNKVSSFYYGTALKALQSSIADEKSTYIGCDINLYGDIKDVLVGLNLRNIVFTVNDTEADIPFYIALGSTMPLYFFAEDKGNLSFSSELRYYPFKVLNKLWDASIGFMYDYQNYSARLGVFIDKDNSYIFNVGTLGISYNLREQNMKFDYTFTTKSILLGFNHTFSFTYFIDMRIKGVRRTYKYEKKNIKKDTEGKTKKLEEELFKDIDEEDMNDTIEWSDD